MQYIRWTRGILALGALALGLLAARSLPAHARVLPINDASCSNKYYYQLVARAAAPQPLSVGSADAVAGYLDASLWSKVYVNAHDLLVACHQYHVVVRLCAAPGVTLPQGSISAYIEDEQTGVVGYGWHVNQFATLPGGQCAAVTSLDSLPAETAATATVRGLGAYTGASSIIFTLSYTPTQAHALAQPH
jgi:hypothetical protein